MNCREFADFIFDYTHGSLPDEVRGAFEHHLAICRNCREYLAQYEATVALSHRLAAADAASAATCGVPEDLVSAILAARRIP